MTFPTWKIGKPLENADNTLLVKLIFEKIQNGLILIGLWGTSVFLLMMKHNKRPAT